MDDREFRLLTYADNNQCLIAADKNIIVTMHIDDAPLVSEQIMPITETEFDDLSAKSNTHTIQFDTISENITIMPKVDKPLTAVKEVIS